MFLEQIYNVLQLLILRSNYTLYIAEIESDYLYGCVVT